MEDILPISALNQYAYCQRRCYLIHGEGEFSHNIHTESGTREHERADRLEHEIKQGVRVEFALPVWSDKLGLSGRCDAVEFRPDGSVYPVEYKHGKRKQWLNDDLQLAAQAMCLEEMLNRPIPQGAVYHIQSRRRRDVAIDRTLREKVTATAGNLRRLLNQSHCPPPLDNDKHCQQCSLKDLCYPELLNGKRRLRELAEQLFNIETDNL